MKRTDIQTLARYWGTEYDWRKCEARLNALPQFITEIDGLDIHFIHVRSKHENALPIIVTHGWPGSVVEQLKIIDPLTNPTAYGGSASDVFDVVIPSMPGYGYSGNQVYDGPMTLPDLQILNGKSTEFGPTQSAAYEDGNHCEIRAAAQIVAAGFLQQQSRLILGQPVSGAGPQLLYAFDTANACSQLRLSKPESAASYAVV